MLKNVSIVHIKSLVKWLELSPSNTKVACSIPGLGTSISIFSPINDYFGAMQYFRANLAKVGFTQKVLANFSNSSKVVE